MGLTIEKCLIKTVKLSECPTVNEVIKQLEAMNERWDYIVNTSKNMNIRLEKRVLDMKRE
jgi:hypothetical protein